MIFLKSVATTKSFSAKAFSSQLSSSSQISSVVELGQLSWLHEVDETGNLTFQNPCTLYPVTESKNLVFHAFCGKPSSMDDLESFIGQDSQKVCTVKCYCCQEKVDFFNSDSPYGLLGCDILVLKQPASVQQALKKSPQWKTLEALSLTQGQLNVVFEKPVFLEALTEVAEARQAIMRGPRVNVPCFTFLNIDNPALGMKVLKVTEGVARVMSAEEGFLPDKPILPLQEGSIPFPTSEQFAAFANTLKGNDTYKDAFIFAYLHSSGRIYTIRVDQLPVLNDDGSVKLRLTNTVDDFTIRDQRDFYLNNPYRFEDNMLVIEVGGHLPELRIPVPTRSQSYTPVLLPTVLSALSDDYCVVSIEQHPKRQAFDDNGPVQLSRQKRIITYLQICERTSLREQSGIQQLHTSEDVVEQAAQAGQPEQVEQVPRNFLHEQYVEFRNIGREVLRHHSENVLLHSIISTAILLAICIRSVSRDQDWEQRPPISMRELIPLFFAAPLIEMLSHVALRLTIHSMNQTREFIRIIGGNPQPNDPLPSAILEPQLRYQHGGVSKVIRDEQGNPQLRLLSSSEFNNVGH